MMSDKLKATCLMVVTNVHQLSVDKGRAVSSVFTCADDPLRASFKIKLGFGTTEENKMDIKIIPTSTDVKLFKYSWAITDLRQTVASDDGKFKPVVRRVGKVAALNAVWDFSRHLDKGWMSRLRFLFEVECSTDATVNDDRLITENQAALSQSLTTLLERPNDADFTVYVQDESFECHKALLVARSAYFRGLFQSGMIESRSNQITMEDISPDCFRHVIKFLYSGILPENMKELAFELLPFADKYALEELKSACVNALISTVTMDNVLKTIILAETHSCPKLFRHCRPLFFSYVLEKEKAGEGILSQPWCRRLICLLVTEEEPFDISASPTSACDPPDNAMHLSSDMAQMFDEQLMANRYQGKVLGF